MKKNISKIMNILIRKYKDYEFPSVRKVSELKKNAFKVLISCLLSLRTKDENTAIAVKRLFKNVKKAEDIVKMPIKKLEKLIYSSGFYKRKAEILKSVCKTLIKKFKGKVPSNKKELLGIKHIGPKTANVVLCFAFNKDVIPVDVNVHRVANRLGWVKTKKPEDTEKELEKILPKRYWKLINTLFILHGKNICKPLSPFCSKCFIKDYCKKIGVKKTR